MAELARLAAITKNFGGVRALRGVNFEVQTGEVHALVGENGAGKSTPMRVLGGEMAPSSGEVSIAGKHVDFRGPREARALGIAIIHQELALAPDLSVAENIFLGELSGVISWSTLRRRASELIASLGFDIDPSLRAGALTVAHQQVVEIAKALSRKIKIIVFDDRRADARRGCRREERDLWNHPQTRRGRQGGAGDFLRASGALRALRPDRWARGDCAAN